MQIPHMLWDLPGDARGRRSTIRLPAEGLQELRVDVQTVGNLMLCFDAGGNEPTFRRLRHSTG